MKTYKRVRFNFDENDYEKIANDRIVVELEKGDRFDIKELHGELVITKETSGAISIYPHVSNCIGIK